MRVPSPQYIFRSSAGPVPPPQAAAAGFTSLVLSDTFSVDSVARAGQTTGKNWYPFQNGGLALSSIVVDTSAGTLTITDDASGFSYGVGSVGSTTPTTGTYRNGYFQADILFNPTGSAGSSWPAFWSFAAKTLGTLLGSGVTFAELDFLEAFPGGTEGATAGSNGVTLLTTVHEWTSNGVTNTPAGGSVQNSDVAVLPGGAGFDFTKFHTYGCLWTPTTVTWFIDNQVACGPVALSPSLIASSVDFVYLILGAGKTWPTTFRNIQVWQAPQVVWPGQPGKPVGFASYGDGVLGVAAGGSIVSGTSGAHQVYTKLSFASVGTISANFVDFVQCDFPSGAGGVNITGGNLTFSGCRFQSNNQGNYCVQTSGASLLFSRCSFTPLASLYTAPPGGVWPTAGSGQNTTTQTTDVNCINGTSGYQYGLAINSGGPVTADYCDFWGFGNDAIQWQTTTAQMCVTNCWMHDAANASPNSYHTDILGYVNGGAGPSNILIQGCTMATLGNTNVIAFQAATSGYANINIVSNYISGTGYMVDLGFPNSGGVFSNSAFTDNVLGTDIQLIFGALYGNLLTTGGGNLWRRNKIAFVPGTTWTTGNGWTPLSSMNGQFWVPTSATNSTTDFAG